MDSDPSSSEYRDFAEFLKTATKEDIGLSMCFLTAQVEREERGDHLPIPELVERIRLAHEAQKQLDEEKANNPEATLPPLELNMVHLAFFIYADKSQIVRMLEDDTSVLELRLRSIEPFIRVLLQKPTVTGDLYFSSKMPLSESGSDQTSGSQYQPGTKSVDSDRIINRNLGEADKARNRDEKCIATNCSELQVCHIMPFSLNNSTSKLKSTTKILRAFARPLFSDAQWTTIRNALAPSSGELGTSDKAWNMLSLNPLAHAVWNKAYFALEWVGIEPEAGGPYLRAKLRWHWLPSRIAEALGNAYLRDKGARKGDAGRTIKFESDHHGMATAVRQCFDSASKASTNGVFLNRMFNSRPMISGDVLYINVKPEDADKTRLMIELQWLALKMAAFSAAAEVVDDLDSKPPGGLWELPTYRVPSPVDWSQYQLRPQFPVSTDDAKDRKSPKVGGDTAPKAETAKSPTLRGSSGDHEEGPKGK